MADFVNAQELCHRISNGFVTHDGYLNGEFKDIFAERGINVQDKSVEQILNAVIEILESVRKDRQYTFRIYHEEEK